MPELKGYLYNLQIFITIIKHKKLFLKKYFSRLNEILFMELLF